MTFFMNLTILEVPARYRTYLKSLEVPELEIPKSSEGSGTSLETLEGARTSGRNFSASFQHYKYRL